MLLSSVGQFCPITHDLSKPSHALWASDKIVRVLESHPSWPNIVFDESDQVLDRLKDKSWIAEYMRALNGATKPSKHALNMLRDLREATNVV